MKDNIPDELFEGLIIWQKRRADIESNIKKNTDRWVIAQEHIIKIQDAIKALK